MMKPRRWSAEGCAPSETPGSRERAQRPCSGATGEQGGVPKVLRDAIRAALNPPVTQPVNAIPPWSDVLRRSGRCSWSTVCEHAAGWGTRSL